MMNLVILFWFSVATVMVIFQFGRGPSAQPHVVFRQRKTRYLGCVKRGTSSVRSTDRYSGDPDLPSPLYCDRSP